MASPLRLSHSGIHRFFSDFSGKSSLCTKVAGGYQHPRALVVAHYLLNTTSAAICLLNVRFKSGSCHRRIKMTFKELLGNVGLFGGAVMVCLVALSFFSLAVIIEKHRRFSLAIRQSQIFKPVFKNFLRGGETKDLISALPKHQKSHVAQIVSAGILEYDSLRQPGRDSGASL